MPGPNAIRTIKVTVVTAGGSVASHTLQSLCVGATIVNIGAGTIYIHADSDPVVGSRITLPTGASMELPLDLNQTIRYTGTGDLEITEFGRG